MALLRNSLSRVKYGGEWIYREQDMDQSILIVDDDMQLTSFLTRFLAKHGYRAQTASSGAQTRVLFDPNDCDLVVLDLNLPDADGLDLAREIRSKAATPIIMLTARDEVFDRIVGLEIGADDYLTKPYEPRELLARIKAVLRRIPATEAPTGAPAAEKNVTTIRFEGFELNLKKHNLRRLNDAQEIQLTGAEFSLLRVLALSAGEVLPRALIMNELYGNSITVTDRSIDAHVSRLRRKIDLPTAQSSLIQSVRGEGYVLTAEAEQFA